MPIKQVDTWFLWTKGDGCVRTKERFIPIIIDMEKANCKKSGAVKSSATKLFALLLIICLVECAAEERINGRINKPSNLVGKVNGWRSQRGGSCLSYGHSCWGAHGKRSGKLPASAPDWYMTRVLRQMAAKAETNPVQRLADQNSGINAIYEADSTNNAASTKRLGEGEDSTLELTRRRYPEAIPMLDDDLMAKFKIWQIIRQESEEN